MIKNTFAPNIKNKELTIDQIITGLRTSFIHYSALPDVVKKRVDIRLQNKSK